MNDIESSGFSSMPVVHQAPVASAIARDVQEVQGAIILAKQFPRDQGLALKKIEAACERTKMAERSMYSYPRGGTNVTGPSIRLAEVIAQNWGNIRFDFKEVSREPGYANVVARAWDVETNVSKQIEFKVALVREKKNVTVALTSERDIYELIANQASRRVRNCILAIVPADIVDAAVERCERTLRESGTIEQQRNKMVEAFKEVNVSAEELERRFKKKITAITSIDYVQARKIYQSITDGMSKKEDWFEPILEPEKIAREQASAANPEPMPHEKRSAEETALREKNAAIDEFQSVCKMISDSGGDAETIMSKKILDVLKESPGKILAMTDWLKKKHQAGVKT